METNVPRAQLYDRLRESPDYRRIVARRRKFALLLSAVVLVAYFGLILVIASNPLALAQPISPGAHLTIGIPAITAIFVGGWILMGLYVFGSNSYFDRDMKALIKEISK